MKHVDRDFSTPYDWPRPTIPNEDSEMWPINAMRDKGVALEVINWEKRYVVFANGISLPIVALYDGDGLRVEEWDDAVRYDFGNSTFGYGTANCYHDPVNQH